MNIKQIFKRFRGGTKKKEKLSNGEYVHPARHWMYGLLLGFVIFIGGTSLLAYDFYQQFGARSQTAEPVDQQVTYPDKEVRRLTEQYAAKQKVLDTLRAQRPVIETKVEEMEKENEEKVITGTASEVDAGGAPEELAE